ncbi:PAAR repeat protein [Halorubrum virus HRTV-2]|nr:PAAR repeat protein [Halorubrum virus HRTV-2]
MPKLALIGASCEATGHPGECGSVASGTTQDSDGDKSVTINGTPVATHGDVMNFPSHAHAYTGDPPACTSYSSHDLTPDEAPAITVNGQPVMRAGDSTTDPGSGGTASIINSGGNGAVTHTE